MEWRACFGPIPGMEIHALFGRAVRKHRNALGYSQEWLGSHIGGDQGYVSRIESGQMNVTLETIGAIAAALAVAPAELFVPVSGDDDAENADS
jgi:transcriptional regulator with XRE-family HTH domain